MKLSIILTIFAISFIFIAGCSTNQVQDNNQEIIGDNSSSDEENNDLVSSTIGVENLILNEDDLTELSMENTTTNCNVENYETNEYSSLAQYNMCNYTINNLNDTWVIIELSKYSNLNDLNGSYQYSSSHLFGADGIISENTFGDQSKFHVNTDSDYGAEFNNKNVSYYHLWITKDKFLIHITSSGSIDAKESIANIGNTILSKVE
jgi:hypothetical protein